MNAETIHGRLVARLQQWLVGQDFAAIDPWIEIQTGGLRDVCRYLRNEPDLAFDMLHCITAVDYFEPDSKKAAQLPWQPHIEVIYHLSSMVHRHRIVLKTRVPRWLNEESHQLPEVPSVSDIWRTAEWHEREVFDLSGVLFPGNPDMRRILCPEDWAGHALRKDYQMPSEYHGIPAGD
jgi:NADH-quinone oxidoreductase subunit C